MTKEQFDFICLELVSIVRARAPFDTGNLAGNGVRFYWENEETFVIYVDEAIAPYMPYTNEPWLAERWKGKKNPNEAWWQDAIKQILEYLKKDLKGKEE